MSAPTATTHKGIRCPLCGKKIAEDLDGRLVVTCRHCKETVTIVTHPR